MHLFRVAIALLVLSCTGTLAAAPGAVRWLQQFIPDPTALYHRPSVVSRDLYEDDPSFVYTSKADPVHMARLKSKYLASHRVREAAAEEIVDAMPPFILPSLLNAQDIDGNRVIPDELLQDLTTDHSSRHILSVGPRLPLPREIHPLFLSPDLEHKFRTYESSQPSSSSSSKHRTFTTASISDSAPTSHPLSSLLSPSLSTLLSNSRTMFTRALASPQSSAYLSTSDAIRQTKATMAVKQGPGHKKTVMSSGKVKSVKNTMNVANTVPSDLQEHILTAFSCKKNFSAHSHSHAPSGAARDCIEQPLLEAAVPLMNAEELYNMVNAYTTSDTNQKKSTNQKKYRLRNAIVERLKKIMYTQWHRDGKSGGSNTNTVSKPMQTFSTSTSTSTSDSTDSDPSTSASNTSDSAPTPECQQCRVNYTIKAAAILEYGADYLIEHVSPICSSLWPSLAPTFGPNLCDPLVPGECEYLCRGMIKSWSGAVAEVFSIALGDAGYHCYYTEHLCPRDTSHDAPAYPHTVVEDAGPVGTGAMKVLQLSDIHWDEGYEEGERVDCKMPVCCRKAVYPTQSVGKENPFGDSTVSVMSVAGGGGGGGAGHYGAFTCDSPMALVESVVKEIPKHDVKHVIFTGDAPAHDLWEQTHEVNLRAISTVTNITLEYITEGVQYWPVLGNHAAAPVNQFGGPGHDAWLLGPVANEWSTFLGESTRATLAWGGYYTKVMDSGLHAIALQTNYYDDNNMYLKWGVDHWDLGGQLSWLDDVLGQIQALGQKAVLFCHEKPLSFSNGVWALKFQDIVEKYSDNIVALLAGHNHNDMTHIIHKRSSFMSSFHGDNALPDSIAQEPWLVAREAEVAAARNGQEGRIVDADPLLAVYLASSISPVEHSTNPCYRVYDMNREELQFTDFTQYKLDLVKANRDGGAEWEVEYVAKEEYGLPDLTPRSWHDFGIRMSTDQSLVDKYNNNYSAGYGPGSLNFTTVQAACNVLTHLQDEHNLCMSQLTSALP